MKNIDTNTIGILIKNVLKVIEYGSYISIIAKTGYTAYIKYLAMVKGDPKAFEKMTNMVPVEFAQSLPPGLQVRNAQANAPRAPYGNFGGMQ